MQDSTDTQMLSAGEVPVAEREAMQPVATSAEPHADMNSPVPVGTNSSDDGVAAAVFAPAAPCDQSMVEPLQGELPVAPALDPISAGADSAVAVEPMVDAAADAAAVPAVAEPVPALMRSTPIPHGTLGQRLRAAREVRGWKAEDVASRLRLPLQIVQMLEAEQYEKIGYGIYLRGYLSSYARLVDVPTVLIEPVLRDRTDSPPLVSSGTISHSRYLYQRYSVSALYLILTAVIIVPAVMLAMRASLEPQALLTALSVPQKSDAAQSDATVSADPAAADSAAEPANQPASSPAETPLVASLAPFSALSHKEPVRAGAPAAASGAHSLKLSLKEASWVEVVSATGEKLEYGLLAAGSVRSYSSDKPLDVRLGNCSGAEVETDGQVQDLTPFRRSNVAHFKLFTGGEAISHTDS